MKSLSPQIIAMLRGHKYALRQLQGKPPSPVNSRLTSAICNGSGRKLGCQAAKLTRMSTVQADGCLMLAFSKPVDAAAFCLMVSTYP